MAKRATEVKPIFPIKHEFVLSLDNFIHQSGLLRDAVRQALQFGKIEKGAARDILVERLAAFDMARFGDADAG